MKTNNLIFPFIVLGVLFLLMACQKDDKVFESESTGEYPQKKHITFQQLENRLGKHDEFSKLSPYFDVNYVPEKSSDSLQFVIASDEIVVFEEEGKQHYTLRIKEINHFSISFYNLLFSYDESKDELVSFIIKYMPDGDWVLHPDGEFRGQVAIIESPFTEFEDLVVVEGSSNLCVKDVSYVWICDAGNNHEPGNSNCYVGGNVLYINYTYGPCDDGSSFIGTIGSPGGDGGGSGGGGAGGVSSGIGYTVTLLPCDGDLGMDGGFGDVGGDGENCLNAEQWTLYQYLQNALDNSITQEQANWIFDPSHPENYQIASQMLDLLQEDNYSDEAAIATKITLSTLAEQKLYDNTYFNIIHQHTNFNNSFDPVYATYFSAKCAVIKAQNPTWPDWRVYWEASKEMVHLVLDIGGLVPVVGEVCDIVNGVIYTIEGDGVNASLSFAAAIPIAGWFATGAKVAYKGTNKFVVKAGNIIDFGNRSKLRKNLGIATGSFQQAHHIIPWAIRNHDVVQKAAKSGNAFHMNEVLNGIAVAAWRNQPNHNNYNNIIIGKLEALPTNLTPNQAYTELANILNQAKQAIINNPNMHLNDLIF